MKNGDDSIVVEGLSKSYGSLTAIQNLSFRVGHGEVVGFLGPNGAGKSTTMRILAGILPATSGTAHIAGIPVATQAEAVKRRIGYMPENNPLPPDLRVEEYLRLRARLKELPGKTRRARVKEVLDICELNRKTRRKLIRSLSKGFRQRVGIADTILARPSVAIMDEPTIGLDPHQILIIRQLINSLRGDVSLIISSHILAEVEMSCDRIIIINQGRIVASGTMSALRKEFLPYHSYTASIQGSEEAFRQVLAEMDPDATIEDSSQPDEDGFRETRFRSGRREDFSEALLARLVRRGDLRVRALQRRPASLEEVFLAATRRSWEAENVQTVSASDS